MPAFPLNLALVPVPCFCPYHLLQCNAVSIHGQSMNDGFYMFSFLWLEVSSIMHMMLFYHH